ncbi:uncharacterized protein LOC127851271 [Dreissena polymorpha]|uniref:Iron-binding zinc finger CDGSH type domain-containing protein n=1 Tax=Dreissena polymorpha TaxID=45954 RepID=A0A9D4D0A6_DREPO|nr:uncharacterized protein LOC127851271 [Dreissena polymorpha]KAH3736290.1 hypothetical protein DPMN_042853 [Dreissena polymorpha]
MLTVLRFSSELLSLVARKPQEETAKNTDVLYSAATQYFPYAISDVKEGDVKYWCRCGLSKDQPWCDGSHKGTGITPMAWKVPAGRAPAEVAYICGCKHTKNPPFCDGTHNGLKEVVETRQSACAKRDGHAQDCKLCTRCGWVPDF